MREIHQAEDGLFWCSYGCGPFRQREKAIQHSCPKKVVQTLRDVTVIREREKHL